MLRYIRAWAIQKNRRQAGLDAWYQGTTERLLSSVISPLVPYYYDSAFSFLQRERGKVDRPVRLRLFLPSYPLAIDLIGIEGRTNYAESADYIGRRDWEGLMADTSHKRLRLSAYDCPYWIIRDTDATDLDSLRYVFKSLTGSNYTGGKPNT